MNELEPMEVEKTEPTGVSVLRAAERGMTLVEIMVVLVIIGMVTAIVGVNVFSAVDGAKVKSSKVQISNIGEALDLYRLAHGKYPSTSEGLTALTQSKGGQKALMPSVPKDGWDNDFIYIFPGSKNPGGYDLMSYGADGVAGTDDFGNWADTAQ